MEINEDILIRYIDGMLTEEEAAEVKNWRAASLENEKLLEQVYFTAQVASRLKVMRTVNPDEALSRFKSRIHKKEKRLALRQVLGVIQRAAAVLFIPVFLLSAYLFIQQGQGNVRTLAVRTNPGVVSAFDLPDGSKVWLNANSKLVYPTAFIEKERTVFLEGEAYFKVTKDAKPFIVKTDYLQTKVLGTEFNVKSYTAEDSHVTLISGKVQVRSHENARFVDLEPGKDAMLLSDGLFEVKEVNSEAYTYWKDGYFYFDELPLADIMKSIGRWYNVNVTFRNKEAMAYRIHFMSNRQSGIEETIRLMNRLKKVTLTLCENTVYVD